MVPLLVLSDVLIVAALIFGPKIANRVNKGLGAVYGRLKRPERASEAPRPPLPLLFCTACLGGFSVLHPYNSGKCHSCVQDSRELDCERIIRQQLDIRRMRALPPMNPPDFIDRIENMLANAANLGADADPDDEDLI